jgi:hypothetical protein
MGRESGRQIHTSSFSFSCVEFLHLLFSDLEPSVASQLQPPIEAMAPNLPRSRLLEEDGLNKLRRLLDEWMWCDTFPLINLQPGEFIFFSCYTTAGLVPPVSSFFFTLLEFYGL